MFSLQQHNEVLCLTFANFSRLTAVKLNFRLMRGRRHIFSVIFAVLVVPNVLLRQSFAGNVARSTKRSNGPQRRSMKVVHQLH